MIPPISSLILLQIILAILLLKEEGRNKKELDAVL